MRGFLVMAPLCLACTGTDPAPSQTDEETTNDAGAYQPITVSSDWFDVRYVAPRTYILAEPRSSEGNVSYLILGETRAVLFDTGAGENPPIDGKRMKHLVDQITDLPVTLVLSHFHYDHIRNLSEFDEVASIALPYLRTGAAADGTYTFSSDESLDTTAPSSVQIDAWWEPNTPVDLGNRSVKLVNIPGHAMESTLLVDDANRLLFLVDYLYNGELFVFGEDQLLTYETTVDALIATYDSSYVLYGAHGVPQVPHSDLQDLKNLLRCIDEGSCAPTSATVSGWPASRYSLNGMRVLVFT